jgi:hypothetical protein
MEKYVTIITAFLLITSLIAMATTRDTYRVFAQEDKAQD